MKIHKVGNYGFVINGKRVMKDYLHLHKKGNFITQEEILTLENIIRNENSRQTRINHN